MKFILGKKIGMTRKFLEDGTVAPVTIVEANPCIITQIKSKKKDGYDAVQLGSGKRKNLTKPLQGHLKDLGYFRYLREFRVASPSQFKRGDKIDLSIFKKGEQVKVTGVSKGKGFQGVVKRHGFHGSPASHGHKDQLRMPGSIGSTFPQHVIKGKRMAGRMGGEKVTIKNLEIVGIDLTKNQLWIKGAVPGANKGLVLITTEEEIISNAKEKPAEGWSARLASKRASGGKEEPKEELK